MLESGLASDGVKLDDALAPALQEAGVERVLPKGAALTIDQKSFERHGLFATASARVTKAGRVSEYTLYLVPDGDEWRVAATQPATDMDPAAAAQPAAQPATARAEASDKCISSFGGRTPVLLVHGWSGEVKNLGTLADSLSDTPGILVERFNYKNANDQWVNHQAIGPALAKRIACLSDASLKGGGDGKVIVVAHSMGGLAARFAADQIIDGRKVADMLRLVITLGTPHKGSLWGNVITGPVTSICQGVVGNLTFNPLLGLMTGEELCLQGLALRGLAKWSDELNRLADFPKGVPVKAIAGHYVARVSLFDMPPILIDTASDGVVGVDSATEQYTEQGKGDGKMVFRCESESLTVFPCHHTALPNAPRVQNEVRESIRQNLSSTSAVTPERETLPLPKHRMETTFLPGMHVPYLENWAGAMSEAGSVLNVVDNSSCHGSNATCPHIMFINMDAEQNRSYADKPVAMATQGSSCVPTNSPAYQPAKHKTRVTVGGESADYYEQQLCPPGITPQLKAYVWVVKGKGLVVSASDTIGGPINMPALRASLDNVQFN
jgi:pimeloyl-ACP methyl ester carboxylesterase